MEFLLKNALFHRLKAGGHLEEDKALLLRKDPKNKVLTIKHFDKEKAGREILYALLDVATEEEIKANREGKKIVLTSKGKKKTIIKKKSKHQKMGKK